MTLGLLLAPVALGDLWIVTGRRAHGGKTFGGGASAVLWQLCYTSLLAWAVYAVVVGSLWLNGYVGLVLLWSGALLRVLAHRQLGRWYAVRIVLRDEQELVTSGPYRLLRHPLHLGLLVEMTGFLLFQPTWLPALPLLLAVVTLIGRNLREDRALAAHFGPRFRAYCARAWDVVDLLPGTLPRR